MSQNFRCRNKDYFQCDLFGELYAGDAKRVGKYGFPELQRETLIPTQNVKPFNYMMSVDKPEEYWIHCFVDDYQFERLWNNLGFYMPYILRLKGFISTDFSLYRDYDDEILIRNCYRNRCIAYAVQMAGGNAIPTAGFGPERTWGWCFDGLPCSSSVAITTNGIWSDAEAQRIFVGGVDALVYTLKPKNIIVCGKCPAWLKSKYPDINIVCIPSYGQMWKQRRCA